MFHSQGEPCREGRLWSREGCAGGLRRRGLQPLEWQQPKNSTDLGEAGRQLEFSRVFSIPA